MEVLIGHNRRSYGFMNLRLQDPRILLNLYLMLNSKKPNDECSSACGESNHDSADHRDNSDLMPHMRQRPHRHLLSRPR